MRQAYDSDITREQFNQIVLDLEFTRKRTRPRKIDLYDVFCAILYTADGQKHRSLNSILNHCEAHNCPIKVD